ncbi:hypothetical protein MMC17_008580 [Xylographa soralifera]|nr:hypothetical protein [Xylographa soralifera]
MGGSNPNVFIISLITLLGIASAIALPAVEKRQASAPPVLMGAAASYGAIAHTTLTSTDSTLVTGDCGTYPGTAITGFPPGICTGTTSAGGVAAQNAEAACLTAYNNAKGLVPTKALSSVELGGMTLGPGSYTFPASAAQLSTTLTLDGASDNLGQFVFQIATTFMTAIGSNVLLINGAQAGNVYFQVGTSATIGGATMLQGNVLALDSVAVGAGAANNGTLCALNGAVTLINDALTAQTTTTTKQCIITIVLGKPICVAL